MTKATALANYSSSQIALIRRTVAKDCNDMEFDLFFEAAQSYGLDPFRKQISAIVFNKKKEDKRQMAIIVSRDGYRVIAQRCGDYRPASEPAQIVCDDELKSGTNPHGIISACVRLWKQDKGGDWFPVIGEAYWDEFAQIKDEWGEDQSGKWKPTGKKTLDGNWGRMPRVMITKCAESQALRAGWPDQFGGLYVEEEMGAAQIDATASEVVRSEEERERIERIGGANSITASFDVETGVLENVPVGQMHDRCEEFIKGANPEIVHRWSVQNRVALQQFWAAAPSDALAIKQMVEPKIAAFQAQAKGEAA